ncbi:MAG: Holliday junction branch migration protein RuvA [Lachnospiraceae bacterium]|nr:Holliday junction branch migration protein RuvA [Lachnospiraceae bacterium]
MISFLQGTIEEIEDGSAVIGVGGIGFQVQISSETVQRLSSMGRGAEVRIYTFTYLREDMIALFGFLNRDELELFKRLITVSGIGPKGGLSLLSAFSADDLRFAILSGDVKTISRAPGIGKKTAERLVIDLRDKINLSDSGTHQDLSSYSSLGAGGAEEPAASSESEAIEALTALGYARVDAARAVRKAAAEAGTEDTEAILKAALKYML